MGQEAGGKTTDTMNKNRIQGRRWLGKGAMDSDARYSLGSRRGKFGVACREALSLIPGGPKVCQQWLRALLDGHSLEALRQWPHGHKGLVNSVAFSPDSQRILSAGDDGIVRVWDAATGAQVHDLPGGANRMLCAMYSPDGQRIASGGFDDNVRIWNGQTFKQVAQLGGHQEYVYSLAWRADSQQLLSCSGDHTVRIWDTQSLKDRLQARRERQTILAEVEPMVQRLFAELGDAGKVVEKVKADVSLSARARQVALQVVLKTSLDRINAAVRQPSP